jgi:hypothetical protein
LGAAAGNGSSNGGQRRLVHANPGTGCPDTPRGSQALGSPPPAAEPNYSSDERDPLPLGHPDTRLGEAWCIIQRGSGVNEAEEALRFSLVAMVTDATREVAASDVAHAIGNIRGVEIGSFSVVPFFPEHFIVHCGSRETRDRILAASTVPTAGTFLVLQPWTRLAQANSTSLQCRVNIELEGILAHAWCEDTAAKILAPACWIQSVDPTSTGRSDISAFTHMDQEPKQHPQGCLANHRRQRIHGPPWRAAPVPPEEGCPVLPGDRPHPEHCGLRPAGPVTSAFSTGVR